MKTTTFSILLLIISTRFLLVPDTVRAQTLSLSLSPPLIEVFTQPDHPLTVQYTIKNRGTDSAVVSRLLGYTSHGLQDLDPADTTPSWIRWQDPSYSWNKPFSLHAGEEKTLTLIITPNTSIPEQDYYRAVTFRTVPIPGSEFSQSIVEAEVSSVILTTITSTGNVAKSVQIQRFQLPTVIDSFGPLPISIDVKNTGSVFTRLTGSLTLTGPIGQGSYLIEPRILLSQDSTRLAVTTGQEHLAGSTTTALLPGLFLGKYTVVTTLQLDQSDTVLSQQRTVYALPWKGVLCLTVLIPLIKYLFFRQKSA